MQIIRIEHKKDKKGIFQSMYGVYYNYSKFPYKERLIQRHNKFPTPRFDSCIDRYIDRNEFCAFKSISQIHKWFTKRELRVMIDNGFDILLIEVNKATIGEYQILFKRRNIISSKVISDLFIK